MKNTTIDSRKKTENSQIFYIIDTLSTAIDQKKQVLFKYYEHLTSERKNKGERLQVSPYALICSNGYYYLIGYSEKHEKITAFRADCITGIPAILNKSIVEEPEDMYTEKYLQDYSSEKNDNESEITLFFENCYIDAMINRFGQNMDISYASKDICKTKVKVQINNAFFAWIFGFDGKVRISSPREVKDQYIRMVSREMARL